jgi:hypothetical protein
MPKQSLNRNIKELIIHSNERTTGTNESFSITVNDQIFPSKPKAVKLVDVIYLIHGIHCQQVIIRLN